MAEREPFGKKVKKFKVWPPLLSSKGQTLREIKLSPGGSNGEANIGINVGGGAGVYKDKSGIELEFKTLIAGSNITLTPGIDTITISSSGGGDGEVNTASNVGVIGDGLFKQKVGSDLEFKKIVSGANIIITPGIDTITVSSVGSGEVNTASNVGSGAGVFKQKTGVDLEFKSFTAGTNITLTQNANDIEISSSGGGGGALPNVQSFAVTPINLTLTAGDYFYYIGIDSSIGATVVNLPAATTNKYFYTIKDIGCQSNSNNITINTTGGENIIGRTVTNPSITLKSKGGALQFISDGIGNWWLH